ncbi:MAG: DUF2530 domain-containing protein [Micromonosporaceae bacterium]|nr:DUF2530 domain-containing protein [Micromonosporaceae bacterium]
MTERSRLRRLSPLDPPMVPFAVAGTVLWLVLGLGFLAIRPTLARGGNEDWPVICFTGAGLGLVGIVLMAIHDRGRARQSGSSSGQADTDTVAR